MVRIVISMFLIGLSINLVAQEVEVSDDELRRFAVAMDSVDQLKSMVGSTVKEMVGNTEDITPSRYNALYKVSKNEEKLAELNDKYIRIHAEFDNYRRRTNKEKLDIIANANEGVFKDFLPVLDDFERAIENNIKSDDLAGVKEGFNLIHNKFSHILTSKGVSEMKSKD